MAQIIPLIGAGFAKVGAIAGVAGAGAATAGAGIVSSVAGGILSYAQGRYQSAILMRMAGEEEKNAARVREAGAKEAMMQDEEALAQISDTIATQGASGFALSSGSFVRKRNQLFNLASRDRTRIVEDSEVQAKGSVNRAYSYKAEAKSQPGLFSTLLTTGLGINQSLISGANINSTAITSRVNNTARGIN